MDPELAFPDILFLAAPLFALGVALEWWLVRCGRARGRYAWRDAAASVSMGVGSLASDLLLGAASLALLMGVWEFRLFDLGAGPLTLLAAFVAGDFIYYWKHRFAHTVRWWWTAHVVHHSSTHYNLTTALRQPWNNHWTGHVLLSSPLVLLGFHPLVVGFGAALNLLYQYWIHTEAVDRMPGWFEAVFNTPSHHRVHHATEARYLDRNFAGVLIVWDKLFGTFQPEDAGGMTYGTVRPIGTHNPLRIAFGETVALFRDAGRRGLSPRERLLYVIGPPGWSHDGSRQTSREMRAAWQAAEEGAYGEHEQRPETPVLCPRRLG